ncbi:hypothetical protein G6F64_014535 [Rhizopus arrhizus]|uniref:Uncharacterized protein n=1 Tax=Rhizopus oryzae TaxID=64495 RepID=A0A9P6WTF9_RHIOR|nr:hypothetical protein G6F64_014535 [Rhizopus arrhizus]
MSRCPSPPSPCSSAACARTPATASWPMRWRRSPASEHASRHAAEGPGPRRRRGAVRDPGIQPVGAGRAEERHRHRLATVW